MFGLDSEPLCSVVKVSSRFLPAVPTQYAVKIAKSCADRIGLWPTVALTAGLTIGTAVLLYKTPTAMRYLAGYFNPSDGRDDDSGTDVDAAYRRANQPGPRLSPRGHSGTDVDEAYLRAGTDIDAAYRRANQPGPQMSPRGHSGTNVDNVPERAVDLSSSSATPSPCVSGTNMDGDESGTPVLGSAPSGTAV